MSKYEPPPERPGGTRWQDDPGVFLIAVCILALAFLIGLTLVPTY